MNSENITQCEQVATRLADIFKEKRIKLSLSKSELSQRSGISRSAILRIETGQRQPTVVTMLRLTKAMEIDLWKLIKEAEKDK